MGQFIISVGREYGSGGHEIATILAEKFNVPYGRAKWHRSRKAL